MRRDTMQYSIARFIKTLTLSLAVTFGTLGTAQAADKIITFGWTAWSDAEFVTKLAQKLIEENYDYEVELKLSSIGVQYQGVAGGDLDGMLMAWLPSTHESYWDKVGDQVVSLGPLYEGAKLGWVVPDYIPEDQLSSIEDLKKPEIKEKLGGSIQGIDPGAGLMQLSEKTIEGYDLDYNLQPASGSAMTAALARADRNEEWILVTGWTPHWMFGRWDLRFLDDPKGTLGEAEHIDVVVRQDFQQEHPQVAGFLDRMHLPLEELQAAMDEAQETSYEDAINNYVAEHPDRIGKWLGQ